MVPPPNSSLLRGGPVKGVGVPGLFVLRCVLFNAFRNELVSVPYRLPCQLLVPCLVMMLTTETEFRPYAGPYGSVTITYCCTNSVSLTNSPGPPPLLSLLFWASI